MFALVQDGSITKMLSGRRGLTIGENQYPGSIFTVWSESDRNAIGIYKVIWDNTNKKNQEWYIELGSRRELNRLICVSFPTRLGSCH